MSKVLKPDLCVIGAGSAGLSVAASARAFGASVVLIEKGEMGGDCLNSGCVPSKALIAASKAAHAGANANRFGVRFAPPEIDFAQVHAHVHAVIAQIAPHDSQERFEKLGATVIRAAARFVDAKTVEAGGIRVRARRFVVATGSRPAVPPIPGLEGVDYLTNETVFSLTETPRYLIVIGGGPIGMELAQAFVRLGAKVTLVEMDAPLGRDDPELAGLVVDRLKAEGVDLLTQSAVSSVSGHQEGVTVRLTSATGETILTGSHLLVAAGRAPVLDGLGLSAANVAHGKAGITVDAGLRTSNRKVFAIGDVTGGRQFTHVASYQAGLVIRSALFGLPVRQRDDILPWCTYTDPELAGVGLSAEAARARYGDAARVIAVPLTETDRGRAERLEAGLVKLIAHKNGRILGCSIAGPGAGEMIGLIAFAMASGRKMSSLAGFVAPYPTLTEALRRAGLDFFRDRLGSPWLARWLSLIRLLP